MALERKVIDYTPGPLSGFLLFNAVGIILFWVPIPPDLNSAEESGGAKHFAMAVTQHGLMERFACFLEEDDVGLPSEIE